MLSFHLCCQAEGLWLSRASLQVQGLFDPPGCAWFLACVDSFNLQLPSYLFALKVLRGQWVRRAGSGIAQMPFPAVKSWYHRRSKARIWELQPHRASFCLSSGTSFVADAWYLLRWGLNPSLCPLIFCELLDVFIPYLFVTISLALCVEPHAVPYCGHQDQAVHPHPTLALSHDLCRQRASQSRGRE